MTRVKQIWIVFLIIISLMISFFAGALTAGFNYWFQPLVHVQISNHSGQTIRQLKLQVQTAGVQHEIFFQPLENNKTIETQFFVQGEGGYRLEATLANGQTISEGQGYIESGYTVKEVVRANGITSTASY
ncbi:hypothetical protein [Acinetobacter higginsii]|uniref:Uncharacterized protein n=1 Tax=Acinetobacter higginsii TaxID=70347 RepID=N8WEX9_9GAMM|nr:hypothetical protein [Acinetobacter higginsii]ENV10647.1 hypothetical protein F966_00418 [Acinetobacter higginsii]MCH7297157.1 hypothetical protein [Acinetobacter higginsii]